MLLSWTMARFTKDISRRQFLAQSAGIAGFGLGRMPPRSPGEIRLGFIGLGDRGRHLLGSALRATARRPGARVVAVCDVNPRNLKRALEIAEEASSAGLPSPSARPRVFDDYRALLDDKEVDAVFIATPVHLHVPQAVAATAAGKHIYCEKPLAQHAEGCREVLEAARTAEASGRIFQIGFQRRYSPRYRSSIGFLHGDEAGRVLFLRAQWHATGDSPRDKPWIFQRDKSGDIVVEQACHQFDIFDWVLGAPPLRACGFGGTSRHGDEPPGRNTMDHYGVVLEYPGGAKVHLSHLTFAIPDRRFSGIYELAFTERMGVDLANALVWCERGGARQLPAVAGKDTELAIEGFFRSVETGTTPEASARAGYRATLAALLCRRAIESGRVAEWREIEPA